MVQKGFPRARCSLPLKLPVIGPNNTTAIVSSPAERWILTVSYIQHRLKFPPFLIELGLAQKEMSRQKSSLERLAGAELQWLSSGNSNGENGM